MSGKGRALDNVYVERLWRSLKYEDIYLRSYESMRERFSNPQIIHHFSKPIQTDTITNGSRHDITINTYVIFFIHPSIALPGSGGNLMSNHMEMIFFGW